MEVNAMVHGFCLLKKDYVKEAASTAYLFRHEKSGARLLFLANDDDNKVFSISFRTPPFDDTGVAHIVEHSTLCGSRKYPLKEPFVELVKGSLNTFLNAMTYPDKTMYPVASRNAKDFRNLMDVYLDAVFYPSMRENPQVLMQEGWHYEITNPEEPLRYSGVVYNEMKGAFSAPDDVLESRIMHALYPDTTYQYESGGDPAAIPQLTQEKFIAFHSRYYHPSNSYIYLYGDLDMDETLAYLDGEYLSHFDKITVDSEVQFQPPFTGLKRVHEYYPVSPDEETKDKTFLALNWVTGEAVDKKTMLGLEILEHALLRTQAAPLRKALVDAHLGKDVDSNFEENLRQPYFEIVVNNAEPDRAQAFYDLTMATLKKLADEGIDRELMEASLNLLEFRLRESDFGSAPKGLIYGIRIMKSWLYDGDPTEYLRYEKLVQEMKKGLDNGYFEDLIRRMFLENPHQVLVVMEPDREMTAKREKALAEELAVKKAAMTEEEVRQVIEATKALKLRQQQPETEEALKTIPILKRSDLRREAYKLPLEEREEQGVKVLYSDVETNGIAYLNFYFDTDAVPQDDLPYLFLLGELIGLVDTDKHTYAQLANLQNLHTGGINWDIVTYTHNGEPDFCRPVLRVKAKALQEKLPQLTDLLAEMFMQSRYTDVKRMHELIEQDQTSIEMNLQRAAHRVVVTRIGGYLTPAGRYNSEGSLPFYHFLKQLQQGDFAASCRTIAEKFAKIVPLVFNKQKLTVSVTAPEDGYRAFRDAFKPLVASLSDCDTVKQTYHWDLTKDNEGLTSSSQVQYVAKGANFLKLGYRFTGVMHVLETILRYDYFWTKIRVQGGAYGAFTSFNRNGMMVFGSYRDPNLRQTFDVFNSTADFLRQFTASPREMDKFVIGTMSNADTPLTPQMKGDAAAERYLRNITLDDAQRARDEILHASVEDIRALADVIDACMKEDALCVFGGDEKIRSDKDLFGSVKLAL